MDEKIGSLSIIVPVYNENKNITELYSHLHGVLEDIVGNLEIIFVNDGSTDDSMEILSGLAAADKSVKVIDFSRNFGHQAAIKAGLSFSKTDAVIIMDADLQDPPEVLEQLIDKWRKGFEVVYAIRRNRKESLFLRLLYSLFYRLLNKLSNVRMPLDSGDFCLLDKKIVSHIVAMPERNIFLRGLRSWVGYRQAGVEYDRKERFSGSSKYSFFKLLKLALDGIFSFSVIPLKLSAIFGFVISIFAFLDIVYLFFIRMPVKGTTAITVLVLFLGGVQLITIGIVGEYIGRIYDEVKSRPLFIIKEKINL